MHLHKSISLLIITLLVSCKKQEPKQVWIYDEDGTEILNGNVKEVSTCDSTKGYFRAVYFDRHGKMINSTDREISISQTIIEKDTTKDTAVYIRKITYDFLLGQNGKKIAIIGKVLSDNKRYSSKWIFDKKDNLILLDYNTADSSSAINEYKNDTAGRIAMRKYLHRSGHIEPDIYTYKYDDKHRMIEKNLADKFWLLRKTNFEYKLSDQHDNWIKEEVRWHSFPPLHKDSGTYTITRKITYY